MKANESAAYLKGLFEGLAIDPKSPEGKLFDAAINAISALSDKVEELSAKLHDMGEYVEDMDDDLSAVEEAVFGEEDDEDDDDEDEDGDDQYYEITCPKCGETICFDDSLEGDELTCPACGEHLELDFECDGDCSACEKDCPVVDDPEGEDNAD